MRLYLTSLERVPLWNLSEFSIASKHPSSEMSCFQDILLEYPCPYSYSHLHPGITHILFYMTCSPWSTQCTVLLGRCDDSKHHIFMSLYMLHLSLYITAFNPKYYFGLFSTCFITFLFDYILSIYYFSYHGKGIYHYPCLMFKCDRIFRAI